MSFTTSAPSAGASMNLRFLVFALIVALLPPVMAVLATRPLAARQEEAVSSRLSLAGHALRSRLDAESSRRRELAVYLAEGLAEEVVEALASGNAPPPAVAVNTRWRASQLDPAHPPEIVAVATVKGSWILGGEGAPREVAYDEIPLAAAALDGQRTDGLVLVEGVLHRAVAAPIGISEGALVLLDPVGDDAALDLRNALRVSAVTFAAGGRALASTLPEPMREAQAKVESGDVTRLGHRRSGLSGPAFLDTWLPLGAHGADASALAVDLGGGASAVLAIVTASDLGDLSRMQLWAFAAALLVLIAAGLMGALIDAPVRRQLRAVTQHVVRMRAERGAKLGLADFDDHFEPLVRELDGLSGDLDRAPAPAPVPVALAPAVSIPALGKLELPFDLNSLPPPAAPTVAPPLPSPDGIVSMPPALAAPAAIAQAAESFLPWGDQTAAPLPPPNSVEARLAPDVALPSFDDAKPATPPEDPFAALGQGPDLPFSERSREIALTSEIRPEPAVPETVVAATPDAVEEAHFREVYEAFVALRRECGEGGEPPAFARFAASLRKNREQLGQKFSGREVRFQAYVKEGKAAIKASPVVLTGAHVSR